jgi:hypothetical protein
VHYLSNKEKAVVHLDNFDLGKHWFKDASINIVPQGTVFQVEPLPSQRSLLR